MYIYVRTVQTYAYRPWFYPLGKRPLKNISTGDHQLPMGPRWRKKHRNWTERDGEGPCFQGLTCGNCSLLWNITIFLIYIYTYVYLFIQNLISKNISEIAMLNYRMIPRFDGDSAEQWWWKQTETDRGLGVLFSAQRPVHSARVSFGENFMLGLRLGDGISCCFSEWSCGVLL